MSVVDEQSEFVEQLMINEGMAVWEVALAVASVLLVLAELLHSVNRCLRMRQRMVIHNQSLHWLHRDAVARCETRC